jgi:ABC-type sulfate/molybdate transport systems ATPase subunit
MVTHNPELTTYASRVITMRDGMIDTDSKNDILRVENEHRNIFQPAVPTEKKPLNQKTSKKTKTVAVESKPEETFELPDIEEFVVPKPAESQTKPKPKKKNRKSNNKKTSNNPNQNQKKHNKKSKNKSSAKRNKQ